MANFLASIPKLKGRANYSDWSFAVENYLVLDGLENTIIGTETADSKNAEAKSKLVLSIDPSLYAHIRTAESAQDIWSTLKKMFDDTGFTRRIGLLRTLISSRLEDFDSMESYITHIMETAQKLQGTGFKIDDEWIGSLLLAGLPTPKFTPMIMAIEHSGVTISADLIRTKLLDSETEQNVNGSTAFVIKKGFKNKGKKPIKCYECGQLGHKKFQCASRFKQSLEKSAKSKNNVQAFSALFLAGKFDKSHWYIDSGASDHLTVNQNWLSNISNTHTGEIKVANDMHIPIKCSGDVKLQTCVQGKNFDVLVKDVLYVPELATNLLSVSQLTRSGNTVVFNDIGCRIMNSQNDIIATGELINNMYRLNVNQVECFFTPTSISSSAIWHRRLGHINDTDLSKMSNGIVEGIKISDKIDNRNKCVACCEGKQTRHSFPKSGSRSDSLLEIVHADLCGPMRNKSIGGAVYFLLLTDDCSRKAFVYFLRKKDETLDRFKEFKKKVENQVERRIKILRTDNGGEFCGDEFSSFLKQSGIIHQTSNPYTPEQNGLSERMNRTVVEKARCMLFDAKLDVKFWAEAVNNSVYLINRSPCSNLKNKTPYEMWTGKKPNIGHLRVFGSQAMVHVPKQNRTKWDKKSKRMILVGFDEYKKGYRLIDPNTLKLTFSRDVVVMEQNMAEASQLEIELQKLSQSQIIDTKDDMKLKIDPDSVGAIDNIQINDSVTTFNSCEDNPNFSPIKVGNNIFNDDDNLIQLRRSERQPKQRIFEGAVTHMVTNVGSTCDPITVKEALEGVDGNEWRKAMQREMNSLLENRTWELSTKGILTGGETIEKAQTLQQDLIKVLQKGGFKLRKWAANHDALLESIPVSDREAISPLNINEDDHVKALGLRWHPVKDCFFFKVTLDEITDAVLTKRQLLSEIASLFDPMGWLQPCIVVGKIMIQQLWLQHTNWDEPVPKGIDVTWQNCRSQLPVLQEISITRWLHWSSTAAVQVHGFCDASEAAYAAAIYVRIVEPDGSTIVQLVTSKSKVALLKVQSIPRLELCSAVLLCDLMTTTLEAHGWKDVRPYYWTESMIVLQWLQSPVAKWMCLSLIELATFTQHPTPSNGDISTAKQTHQMSLPVEFFQTSCTTMGCGGTA